MRSRFLAALLAALAVLAAPGRAARAVGDGDGFVVTLFGTWSEKEAIAVVDEAARAGARHVTFLVWLDQDSPNASSVRWDSDDAVTPFSQSTLAPRLARAIAEARRLGLSSGIDPIVKEPGGSRRIFFWPADRAAWFASYGARMRELAAFAEAQGCDELVAGSELSLLFQDAAGWRAVIGGIREVFTGHVTVGGTFPDFETYRFWDACDSIGLSAYFPLASSTRVRSVLLLTWVWRAVRIELALLSRAWGKPVTFVEVGYPATSVAAVTPWDFGWAARTADEDLQRRCFEAFRRVWAGDPLLRRFAIWGGQTPAMDRAFTGGKGFRPLGKAADPVVRGLLSDRAK